MSAVTPSNLTVYLLSHPWPSPISANGPFPRRVRKTQGLSLLDWAS